MFGLMKAYSCGTNETQRETWRKHYCGTCKSIGSIYGQKSRLLLNHDAVFLGELLTALDPMSVQFAQAYQSRNCLAMPRKSQIPWTLNYAATTNVILAHFKLQDHIEDTRSKLFRFTHWIYSPEFGKAKKQLQSWGFPLQDLCEHLKQQTTREAEPNPTLHRLAEPTAKATALVFEHGAIQANTTQQTAETMAQVGNAFGQIAYLADAIQDQEKDAKEGAFNALTATQATKEQSLDLLRTHQSEVLSHLRNLPIPEDQISLFSSRLRKNLNPLLAGTILPMYRGNRRRNSAPDTVYVVKRRQRDPICLCCCCDALSCCDCCVCEGLACCECAECCGSCACN